MSRGVVYYAGAEEGSSLLSASRIIAPWPLLHAHGATLAQLAIAWTLVQPGLTYALVGARNPRQALENAAAGDIVLAEPELAVIGEALERFDKRG